MKSFIKITLIVNIAFTMTGYELATLMKEIPKPIDTQSESSMILTNRKRQRKKTLKLNTVKSKR